MTFQDREAVRYMENKKTLGSKDTGNTQKRTPGMKDTGERRPKKNAGESARLACYNRESYYSWPKQKTPKSEDAGKKTPGKAPRKRRGVFFI